MKTTFLVKNFRTALFRLRTSGLELLGCSKLFMGGLALIFLLNFAWAGAADSYEEMNRNWERFGAVYSCILESYYSNLSHEEIMGAAIYGILNRLDPYSQVFDEEDLIQLQQETTGRFTGLGITVTIKDNYPIISSLIDGSPAQREGLLPGDLIVAIEGSDTYGLSLDQIVNGLRGEAGSEVSISVAYKIGTTPREVVIKREIIKIRSVILAEEVQPDIGYVSMRRTRFSENTAIEVEEALKSLRKKGIKGVIFDLRGNPGGVLSQATQVVDLFLAKGLPIVSIRERDGCRQETKYSQRRPVVVDLPLVVLIDGGSASASEIVAGAVQDNDRGIIMGTTSFGKGSVQTIFELQESGNSALKLTTALYFTPSGRSIHREIASRPQKTLIKMPNGGLKLPADVLFDLLIRAADLARAVDQLQVRFDLEKVLAEQILSIPLGDLVGKATSGEIGAQPTKDAYSRTKKVFHTLNGREVYGGGGIVPDVEVRPAGPASYSLDLEQRRLFFDFVVNYLRAGSVPVYSDGVPEVDEEMLEAFRAFLRDSVSSFRYSEPGRSELEVLRKTADEMGWNSLVLEAIDRLEEAIEQEWAQVFSPKLEPHIRTALKREIFLRVKGQRAQFRVGLDQDPQLEEAIGLLQDLPRYSQLLQGKLAERCDM